MQLTAENPVMGSGAEDTNPVCGYVDVANQIFSHLRVHSCRPPRLPYLIKTPLEILW